MNQIAKRLEISPKSLTTIHITFNKLFKEDDLGELRKQYLAHLVRAMEALLRKLHNNPFFKIDIVPLPDEDINFNVGTATYFKKRYFSIFYHPKIEVKQLRVLLAHELGHLFLASLLDQDDPQEMDSEKGATAFAMFAILDKNQFYSNDCHNLGLIHKSFDAVIDDFTLLKTIRK